MKILCDVCHKVATFFCPSDEASLCHGCDRTIHHANKLAHKHKRFSLHHPTSPHSLCDICRVKRAYVFCKEDRAILCRECDLSIHEVNQHTMKHTRFLLSGVKIGDDVSSHDTTTICNSKTNTPSWLLSNGNISSSGAVGDNMACDTASVSTSSISQYLIHTIPGYCMEDLPDASFVASASNALSEECEDRSAFQNQHVEPKMRSFPPQAWVPQFQDGSAQLAQNDSLVGVMEMPKAKAVAEGYSNWIYSYDDAAYEVPSISPPLIKKCKRSR